MREMFRYMVAVSFSLMMTIAISAQGQQPTQGQPSTQGQGQSQTQQKGSDMALSANDRTFFTTAGQGNVAEVELGNLAEKKGNHSEVKALAQHLVKDHTASLKELQALASSKNVTIPTTLDKEHEQMKDRLEKLEGASFDKAYATEMVNGHKKMIGLFEQASKSKDAQISAYAEKTLPVLREHLTHAQKAQAAAGGAASTSGTESAKPNQPENAPGTTPK
jgi:putative membrane protein